MSTVTILEQLCNQHDLSNRQGYADTYLEEVKLFRISNYEDVMPMLYNRGFIFIGKGRKTGKIGGIHFDNGPEQYLIVTTPQPIECETFVYDDQMLGIYIELNLSRLHRLVSKLQQISLNTMKSKSIPFSVVPSIKTDAIETAFQKLLEVMKDRVECAMLGESVLDELYFRILQEENAYVLHELCEQGSAFSKVSKVIEQIHDRLNEKISVDEMARMTDMSVNSFHRTFKEAFNDTPVQYIKKVRLNKARQYIVHEQMKAVDAAEQVGYESPTQFSREFKRYFGVPPSQADTLGYTSF